MASAILRVGGARFVILFRGKVYQDKLGLVEGLISEFKGVRKELRDVTVGRFTDISERIFKPLQHASFNP